MAQEARSSPQQYGNAGSASLERLVTINTPEITQKVCLECNRQFTGIVAACPHDGTLLVKLQQDSLIGTILDNSYEVISIIGHGGMGVVYKARHTLMDRIVAIKMLKSTLISDSMSVKRFQQEVKASARIDHPHAITVYNFGISPEGLPYIVMDFLQGSSLAEVIKAEGHIEVDRGVKIITQACEALAHAHKQGVVHRDLKPSNIVLTEYDEDPDFVKVVDFGVAKLMGGSADNAQRLTQTGEVCGSPVYMSPEQCMGQELDLRSDIYSMGILIYETLTGKLPLIGRTMVDTMSKHVSEMPPTFSKIRPDLYIPERIEQVVMKAMAKDPADRHQNMDELREDLENAIPKPGRSSALRHTQSSSMRDSLSVTSRPEGESKKLPMPAIIAASVAAVIVAALAVFGVTHIGAFSTTKSAPPQSTAPSMSPSDSPDGHVKSGSSSTPGNATAPNASVSPGSTTTPSSPSSATSTSTSTSTPSTAAPTSTNPTKPGESGTSPKASGQTTSSDAATTTPATSSSSHATTSEPITKATSTSGDTKLPGKPQSGGPFATSRKKIGDVRPGVVTDQQRTEHHTYNENHARTEALKKAVKKHPAAKSPGEAKNPFDSLRHEYLDKPGL
jgi:serine/threonine-protein kinase